MHVLPVVSCRPKWSLNVRVFIQPDTYVLCAFSRQIQIMSELPCFPVSSDYDNMRAAAPVLGTSWQCASADLWSAYSDVIADSHPHLPCHDACLTHESCDSCRQARGSHGGVPGCVWSMRLQQVRVTSTLSS